MARFSKKGNWPERVLRSECGNAVNGRTVSDLNVIRACHGAASEPKHLPGVYAFLIEGGVGPGLLRVIENARRHHDPAFTTHDFAEGLSTLALAAVNGFYSPSDACESEVSRPVERWNNKHQRMIPGTLWDRGPK